MKHLFKGQNPELVLFDLDGTLIDSVPDLAEAVDSMLLTLGREAVGVSHVRHWVGNGAPMLVKRALTGEQEPDDSALDDALFEQAFELFMEAYGNNTAHSSELYPGVVACLEGLKRRGIRMGLVTNKPIRFTYPLLEEFGLSGFFDVVLGGDSLPVKKPDPGQLFHAMQELGVKPENTLMVGDSRNDIGAAKAAGCPVVAVPYGYNHGEPVELSQPDLIVEQLDQLV